MARSYAFKTTPENLISTIEDLPPWDKSGTLHDGGPAWQYTYDDNYRLTHASSPRGKQYDYSYDPADNITAETIPDQSNTATYNNLNEFATINNLGVSHDANGNLLDDGFSKAYQWDAENRLIKVTHKDNAALTTTFRYDGLGRRIVMNNAGPNSPGEMHYLWCGESLCQSRTASDSVLRRYYSEGEYLAIQGLGLYYATDQLSSVRDVLWSNEGLLLATSNYDPYGLNIDSAGLVQTDFGYAAMFSDRQDNLDLTYYRPYDPVTRRWLTRDPLNEAGGVNLYSAVDDNPITLTDSLGLCSTAPDDEECKRKLMEMEDDVNAIRGSDPSDKKGLAQRFRQLPNYPPSELPGHIEQFEGRQRNLQKKIKDYIDSGCGDPPALLTEWASKQVPDSLVNPASSKATQFTILGVGAGYALYRFFRFLPSLAPPLWETIPPNLAIP